MDFFDLWWVAVIGLGFFVVEMVAVFDKQPGGTFSEWIWKVYALRSRTAKYRHVRRFSFGGFWAALTLHFFAGTSAVPLMLFAPALVWSFVFWWRNERKPLPKKQTPATAFREILHGKDTDELERASQEFRRTHPRKG